MPNPDVVDQPGAARLAASDAVPGDAAPVTEPAHVGMIAREPGKALATIVVAAAGAAQTADAASPADSSRGDAVAAKPDTPQSTPRSRGVASRRQKKDGEAVARRKLGNPVPVTPPVTVTPAAISLDDEIKLLRSELVGKLRLQNAQLKSMLERFDR